MSLRPRVLRTQRSCAGLLRTTTGCWPSEAQESAEEWLKLRGHLGPGYAFAFRPLWGGLQRLDLATLSFSAKFLGLHRNKYREYLSLNV